jgi:hypothetical protein
MTKTERVTQHKRRIKGKWRNISFYKRTPKPKQHKGIKKGASISYVNKGKVSSKRQFYIDNQGRFVSKKQS